MSKKYVDITATLNVIGGIYKNPGLLDIEDRYFFSEADFVNDFHKILFGSLFNLHQLGARNVTPAIVEDYLSERPTKLAIYEKNKGSEYLLKIADQISYSSFDYYYKRLKKMTLFRAYEDIGLDLDWLYDPDNLLDPKKKQAQEDWLDKTEIEDIADLIDSKIQEIRDSCVYDISKTSFSLGEGLEDLVDRLQVTPDVGVPLYGSYINTLTRGARLGKFYIRSAATGVGKSRSMMADALYISCSEMWSTETRDWVKISTQQPTLFISTELERSELQTMALAFISGVNENNIVTNRYNFGELERVRRAIRIIQEAPIDIEYLPDFSLKDIEATIKKNMRENDSTYIFLDYIHTSLKILEEISRRSGGIRLREDNVLFMISTMLKDLAGKNHIFIMSGTQLNMDYQHSKTPDQNLLRGAKAIADRVDVGMIMLDVTQGDLEALAPILGTEGYEAPTVKISIYKNRGNGYKGVYLWMRGDKAICRFEPLFVTHWNYELMSVMETKIIVEEN